MNFARDVIAAQPRERVALVELGRDGERREWTFGEIELLVELTAMTLLEHGVRRGDVVMSLIGNRVEWVLCMMACFRIGAVALPCNEQLRAKDLRLRLAVASPELILADERNRDELEAATPKCPVLWTPDDAIWGEANVGASNKTASRARARERKLSLRAHARGTPQTNTHTPPSTPQTGTLAPPPATPQTGTLASPLATPQTDAPAPASASPQTGTFAPPSATPQTSAHSTSSAMASAPVYADLDQDEPALITFTSGTAGEPKAVLHGQRYLYGQRTQAEQWLGARPGDLVWCTATSGWSKSARNVFIAPWLMGATALLHDARFDPHKRLDLIEQEQVSVLCMAPTEYRVMAKRATLRALPSLRGMVAAGEALNPEVLHAWRDATGLDIRDGYGQTETGQLTGMGIGVQARAGSMGKALPGVRMHVSDGELVADPRSVPTFFLGYLGEGIKRERDGSWRVEDRRDAGPWRTGDQVTEDEDGYLRFEGRADDVIISAGYRIGPFEVESALVAHAAVAEAAAVASPDQERGAVVRAVVVLRDGQAPSPALARELQEHVKRETAPYKYPRIVEFAMELPKTASGKIRRAELRRAD